MLNAWRGRFPDRATRADREVYGRVVEARVSDPRLVATVLPHARVVGGTEAFVRGVKSAAENGHLHAVALAAAREVVGGLDRAQARELGTRWVAAGHGSLRLLALDALQAEVAKAGWTRAIRARLSVLQADADPMVAGQALLLSPPIDGEEQAEG